MSYPEVLQIVRAEQIGGSGSYCLRLNFNDHTVREVDFKAFLERSSNPLIRAYLNPELFGKFTIKEGDLIWGDYELCFPIADLYDGKI
jgi:hypothetical protein